jgi:sulfoxide reductase heme-binding subunit YedZ
VTAAIAAQVDGRALWYLTRGTGAISLVLLTLSVVLGVVDVRRWSSERIPRFVVDGLHRTVSLFVVVTLAIHIVTTLLDSFAPIRLVDVFVPFGSAYRPVWIGFGALALDLLLALVITSVGRARLGYRGWRAVHWLAYACWPVALLHALGSGSDVRDGFAFVLSLVCAAAVALAVVARLVGTHGPLAARIGALGAVAAAAVALAIWLPAGPLAPGWAARAGTPRSVLASVGSRSSHASTRAASTPRRTAPKPASLAVSAPLRAPVAGRIADVANPDGSAVVRMTLALGRGSLRRMSIQLAGQATAGGGISLTSGEVTLGTDSSPAVYRGPVSSLNGGRIGARLTTGTGRGLTAAVDIHVDRASGRVTGSADLMPVGR